MLKKIFKGLILAAGGLVCLDATAIGTGLYLGLMMGPANNGAGPKQVQVNPLPTAANPTANTAKATPKGQQFGSRVYVGYKFNQYAGFELGFTYFSGVSYKISQTLNPLDTHPAPGTTLTLPMSAAAGTTARIRDVDLVAKFDYSYNDTIGIFGKAGVAAVYTTIPGGLQPTNYHTLPRPTKTCPTCSVPVNSGSNVYRSKLTPTFTLGVSYDINQSWQADLSWTRILVGSAVGNMNLLALGLSYHFVDVYCGQFLCE
jgi:opacity protein-like surface antigen